MEIKAEKRKIAVVGSRDFNDKERLFRILTKNLNTISLIISGGARGADTLAVEWAQTYGVPYLVFPALWHKPDTGEYDRGAGMRRNRRIVEQADLIVAFHDGVSKGTLNTIETANSMQKTVRIFLFEPLVKKPQELLAD
jgi:predicted Rossmann fold nucleotide-binding protein DprA/Smf involved in DNA uptake